MSLSTKKQEDPIERIKKATKLCLNPIKITWKDAFYEIDLPTTAHERKHDPSLGTTRRAAIVKNVSGYAPPGTTTYIMGPSGAGKTSLLNILASRVNMRSNAKVSGSITFNDTLPVDNANFNLYGSYVEKDDLLFSYFTVREAIRFSARLKLNIPEWQQDRQVESILFDLGLGLSSNSQIGDANRKVLSGGERKRVAIAVEMVSDPSLLILDEPTAGLDSFKSTAICRLLKKLAQDKGKTVISTINSPSSEAFYYFDRLILMADGHIMY